MGEFMKGDEAHGACGERGAFLGCKRGFCDQQDTAEGPVPGCIALALHVLLLGASPGAQHVEEPSTSRSCVRYQRYNVARSLLCASAPFCQGESATHALFPSLCEHLQAGMLHRSLASEGS